MLNHPLLILPPSNQLVSIMKTFISKCIGLVFFIFFSYSETHAQGIYLGDSYLHLYVESNYPSCTYPDGTIDITCPDIINEDSLDLSGMNFVSLEGIQYFTSLRYLDISNNSNELPTSIPFPNSLKVLKCRNIYYQFRLNSLPPELEYYDCSRISNGLGSPAQIPLPPLPATLRYLNCSNNFYSGIINVPPVMDTLICSGNGKGLNSTTFTGITGFTSFPPSLKYLDCSDNVITTLPALPSSLTYLNCSSNIQIYYDGISMEYKFGGITNLPAPLPADLKFLDCSNNYIETIPALPPFLEYLNCSIYWYVFPNPMLTLPNLPPNLRTLIAIYTGITTLPELSDSLRVLNVSSNGSLHCLPHLPQHLQSLNTLSTSIGCLPNIVSGVVLDPVRPLCTPVNNANQCQSFPVVSGNVFYDNNSNGIREPSENYRANIGINLSNGLQTFSNTNGFYNLSADTGTNLLTVAAPAYYAAVPGSLNFNMPTFTSLQTQDIALQPTVMVDSISLTVTPEWAARPGFTQFYTLDYENVGTTTVNPVTIFIYDNTRLEFVSSSDPGVTDNGSSLSFTETNLTPGQRGGYTAIFNVKTTAVPGDTIFVNTSATAGSITVRDSSYTRITASFDPNDKNATPALTPQQVVSGTYIQYLVRFQNTGTDTAFNIVVSDTLNSQLDASSFQMLQTSHPCKVTRNGNNVIFEFLNILLPHKAVNEPASHGYIRFRIKPQSTVGLNSVIPNKVNIYFDYNAPIITNTTNTVITLSPVPLQLLSFRAKLNVAESTVLLNWETRNEINTSIFEIEQSTDAVQFSQMAAVPAWGSGGNLYSRLMSVKPGITYFRLKMIDTDGHYTYSNILKVQLSVLAGGIRILQNPVQINLRVEVIDKSLLNTTAVIFNSAGKLIKTFMLVDGIQKIPLNELAAGQYYIKTIIGTEEFLYSR